MNKLFPYRLKVPGCASIAVGLLLTFFYFYYGFKITIPVFAIYSSFLETKLFTTFETNFTEEIILVLFIVGFSLIIFSKEKIETHFLKQVRIKALTNTIKTLVFWWLFSLLFVYGNGFISVLILNLILPFLIYLAFFYRIKNRESKRFRLRKLQKELNQLSISDK